MRRQFRRRGVPRAQLQHGGQAAAAQHHAPGQSADEAAGMPRQSPRRAQERGLHPQRSGTRGRIERGIGAADTGMRPAQPRSQSAEWNEEQQSGRDKTADGLDQGSPISPRQGQKLGEQFHFRPRFDLGLLAETALAEQAYRHAYRAR
jgi:hypothetical protein